MAGVSRDRARFLGSRVSSVPGNFLNGGTPRGGAYGFKVDVLKKFSELKVTALR